MEDVLDAVAGPFGERQVGQIAFEEFSRGNCVEVFAPAGDEAVRNADTMATSEELLSEMRSDEAGAAGNEIRGQDESSNWVTE